MTQSLFTTYESNFKLNIRDVMGLGEELGIKLTCDTSAKIIRKVKKEQKKTLDQTYLTTLKNIIKSYIEVMAK